MSLLLALQGGPKTSSAAFVGKGLLTAVAVKIIVASAALAGVGTLSATPVKIKQASAAFAGVGTLSATGSVIHSGTAAFTGRGTLSATPVKIGGGTVIPGRPPARRVGLPTEQFSNPTVSVRAYFDRAPAATVRGLRWASPLAAVRGRAYGAHTVIVAGSLLLRGDVSALARTQPAEVTPEDVDLLLLAALLFHD